MTRDEFKAAGVRQIAEELYMTTEYGEGYLSPITDLCDAYDEQEKEIKKLKKEIKKLKNNINTLYHIYSDTEEIECRADEDCDHCVFISVVNDSLNFLKKTR